MESQGRLWAMGWTTGIHFLAGAVMGLFLVTTTSSPAPGPTQLPVQWVPGASTPGVKRPGREAATHLNLVPRL
jgi:hypothetical protein